MEKCKKAKKKEEKKKPRKNWRTKKWRQKKTYRACHWRTGREPAAGVRWGGHVCGFRGGSWCETKRAPSDKEGVTPKGQTREAVCVKRQQRAGNKEGEKEKACLGSPDPNSNSPSLSRPASGHLARTRARGQGQTAPQRRRRVRTSGSGVRTELTQGPGASGATGSPQTSGARDGHGQADARALAWQRRPYDMRRPACSRCLRMMVSLTALKTAATLLVSVAHVTCG